jgi:hypothetical protein
MIDKVINHVGVSDARPSAFSFMFTGKPFAEPAFHRVKVQGFPDRALYNFRYHPPGLSLGQAPMPGFPFHFRPRKAHLPSFIFVYLLGAALGSFAARFAVAAGPKGACRMSLDGCHIGVDFDYTQ